MANQQFVSQAGHGKMQKDLQKPNKKESNKEKQMVKSKGKKSATEVYKGQRPTRVCAECRLVCFGSDSVARGYSEDGDPHVCLVVSADLQAIMLASSTDDGTPMGTKVRIYKEKTNG